MNQVHAPESREGTTTRLVLAALLYVFVALTLPATYPAADTSQDVLAFSQDERYLVGALEAPFHGRAPGFIGYGGFPLYAVTGLFSPFILAHRRAGIADFSYVHYVLAFRITQIVVAVAGLYLLFRLARELCSPAWSLACVGFAMTCGALYEWTITIHPDVFQMSTFFGSVLFLVRYLKRRSIGALILSAAFCGFATGSKYWGIFVMPAAIAAVVWPEDHLRILRSAWHVVLYVVAALIAFLAFNVDFITSTSSVLEQARSYATRYEALHFSASKSVLELKIAKITSPDLFGALAILTYVVVAVRDLGALLYRRCLGPAHLIHICMLTFCAYYFLAYNDPTNLPWGERYLLPFVPLTIVPVAAALEEWSGRKGWWRWLGHILLGALIASQLLKVWGVPPSRVQLGQGDLFDMSGLIPLHVRLARHYERERQGPALVRRWITGNVDPDSSIYVEAYVNVAALEGEDQSDLNVRQIYGSYRVKPNNLLVWRPDYVFTKDRDTVSAIEAGQPYRTVAILGLPGSEVFVLKRSEAEPSG